MTPLSSKVEAIEGKGTVRGSARAQLLEAASTLMRERDGIDVSLSEIATRAQVNSALVKYYFGSKQGLMIALLERDLLSVLPDLEKLVHTNMSATKKMRVHISGLIRLYFRFPYLHRLLMEIIRNADDDVARHIADSFLKPLSDAYAQLIEEGVSTGQFRSTDPKLFYFSIIGACDQIFSAQFVLRLVHGIDRFDDELRLRYLQHTTELLMQGLRV